MKTDRPKKYRLDGRVNRNAVPIHHNQTENNAGAPAPVRDLADLLAQIAAEKFMKRTFQPTPQEKRQLDNE